jgi:small multidrug resistance family-3 protein
LIGGIVLIAYGVIPTWQTEPAFGRVYAAYGGIFIVLSILWGWKVDGWQPDRYDLLGAGIALVGVAIIMWGRNWFR